MIKKWKVTPISSRGKPIPHIVRPDSRSKDDAATPNRTSETIHIRTRKPRRHTTGDTKQSVENIRLAKQLVENMNGQPASQTGDQSGDPNTTLGRKQLISMLKQRYGSEMDSFRTSVDHSEKERIRKERQRERDLRHNQRMSQDNREMINHGGVHHSPAMNGSRDHFSGTGSEGSDDSLHLGPPSQRRHVMHGKSSKHRIVRRSESEEESSQSQQSHNGSQERLKLTTAIHDNRENMNQSKGVVFLQYTDDVKRVNLPATVSSLDTVKALFVTSFPDRVTMQDFEEGCKVVYIKDMESGTYYMLEDVCEVLNRSFLKLHEKEPSIKSFGSATQLANHTPPETTNKSQTLQNTSTSEINQSFDDFKLVGSPETRDSSDSSIPKVTPAASLNKPAHTQSSTTIHTQSNTTAQTHSNIPVHTQGVRIHTESSIRPTPVHTQSSIPPAKSEAASSRVETTTETNQSTPALRNEIITKTRTESTSSSSTQNKNDTKSRVHQPAASHVIRTTNVRIQPMKTRMDSYNSGSSKTESVEDQLDDLTELLKCALDEEERHHAEMIECVNTKNPGKIDPAIIENIQKETETLARKKTLPKHFTPMAMVMAQQESDRKSADGPPPISPKPKMPYGTSSHSAYVKTTHHVTNDVTDSKDLNNNDKNNKVIKIKEEELAKEGFITPPHKHYYDHNNIETTDHVDGITATEINETPLEKVSATIESIEQSELNDRPDKPDIDSGKISDYDEAAMSEISDNLIDQIMDLELEVQARASNKTSMGTRDRSSTGSLTSKSSVTTNSSDKNHDPSYQRIPIVVHVDKNEAGDVKDKSLADNKLSFKHVHKTTENKTTTNDNTTNEDDKSDSVFTNGPSGSSMQHIYASINKVTELPTSSNVTTTFGNHIKSMTSRDDSGTCNIRHHASVTTPDFIELEESARSVNCDLRHLRKDLADMRKYHVESTRSFKADIQKKLLQFRKKAARVDDVLQQRLDVNNNIVFANEHPVRERRHRLTGDQMSYSKKMSDTVGRLKTLEGDMERVRVSVVNKKRVDDPNKLKDLHDELTQLTKGLAEIKNRFHGLHDMLKVVMPDEVKIVSNEERFLKEEPQKLEGLIGRCKVLSGTLFTLERLASVQIDAGENFHQSQTSEHHSAASSRGASTSAANYNYHQSAQIENGFDDLKGKRSVRFSNKNP